MSDVLPPEQTGIVRDIAQACEGLNRNEMRALCDTLRLAMEIHLASRYAAKELALNLAHQKAQINIVREVA